MVSGLSGVHCRHSWSGGGGAFVYPSAFSMVLCREHALTYGGEHHRRTVSVLEGLFGAGSLH